MSCTNCNSTPCTACDKTSCKCIEYIGTTLENSGIEEGDTLCEALAKLDVTTGELLQRVNECCDDTTIEEIGRGSGEPSGVPAGDDPVIYVRDNGDIWTWNGSEWSIMAPAPPLTDSGIQGDGTLGNEIRENFDALSTEVVITEEEYVIISTVANPDGAKILYEILREVVTDSGLQGVGTIADPIKENFDALPTDTALESNEYFIISTATYPDGAKILKSIIMAELGGVTITSNGSVVNVDSANLADVGSNISITPDGVQDNSFTFVLEYTNSTKLALTPSGTGVTVGTSTVQKRWDNTISFDGYLVLNAAAFATLVTFPATRNDYELTLLTLVGTYRPTVIQQFPVVFGAYDSPSSLTPPPFKQYHANIYITTVGVMTLRILDENFFVDALAASSGFDTGNIWLSNITYFSN